jgi:hypothetical protein
VGPAGRPVFTANLSSDLRLPTESIIRRRVGCV